MSTRKIDMYVREVGHHLRLRGLRRRQGLADLRDALDEAARTSSAEDAIRDAGPAADYAANLDAQFHADGAFQRILGMPNSFGPGIGRRLASTFDPADERLLIPRVFGAGWTVNMGAVAVRLGLLRPDDVDDDILAEAADRLALTRTLAFVPSIAAGVAVAGLSAHRHRVAMETGKSQTLNIVMGALAPAAGAALASVSADRAIEPAQRLAMPAVGAALATIAVGSSVQLLVRPRGRAIVTSALFLAGASQLALSYLPVRLALTRRWQHDLATAQGEEAPDA